MCARAWVHVCVTRKHPGTPRRIYISRLLLPFSIRNAFTPPPLICISLSLSLPPSLPPSLLLSLSPPSLLSSFFSLPLRTSLSPGVLVSFATNRKNKTRKAALTMHEDEVDRGSRRGSFNQAGSRRGSFNLTGSRHGQGGEWKDDEYANEVGGWVGGRGLSAWVGWRVDGRSVDRWVWCRGLASSLVESPPRELFAYLYGLEYRGPRG